MPPPHQDPGQMVNPVRTRRDYTTVARKSIMDLEDLDGRVCPECQKVCKTPKGVRDHVKAKHPEPAAPCVGCGGPAIVDGWPCLCKMGRQIQGIEDEHILQKLESLVSSGKE